MTAFESRSWGVPSRTLPGLTYRVDLALDGALVCSCPASRYSLVCWHIRYVKEEMEMSNETSTALVPVKLAPPQALVPSERTLAMIDKTAQLALAGAIALPKELDTREKVAAVMLYGLELGLKPMSALRHIYIVNGRPAPSAEVMAGLLISSEPDARLIVEELTDEVCTMRIVRPQRHLDERYTVTWAEIEKAGLAKNDMNSKYPRDRLRWHCTKRLLRIYAPDAINSLDVVMPESGSVEEMTFSEDELFNEGDDRTVEGSVVERDPITATTKKAIEDAYHTVREARGEEFPVVRRQLGERWGHAFLATVNRIGTLTEDEGMDVLAFLDEETPKPSEPEPAQEALVK